MDLVGSIPSGAQYKWLAIADSPHTNRSCNCNLYSRRRASSITSLPHLVDRNDLINLLLSLGAAIPQLTPRLEANDLTL